MSVLACTLALVLLMDASGSVRDTEYDLQRDATAAALEDPEIVRIAARRGGLAVSVVVFSGVHRVVVPWRLVGGPGQARAVAAELRGVPRPFSGTTRTGAALEFALDHLAEAPCDEEQVVDVSTDGPPDDPAALSAARERAMAAGVRVNGLVVHSAPPEWTEAQRGAAMLGIRTWMEDELRTPDGFVIALEGWEGYPAAIRRKIASEIAWHPATGTGLP